MLAHPGSYLGDPKGAVAGAADFHAHPVQPERKKLVESGSKMEPGIHKETSWRDSSLSLYPVAAAAGDQPDIQTDPGLRGVIRGWRYTSTASSCTGLRLKLAMISSTGQRDQPVLRFRQAYSAVREDFFQPARSLTTGSLQAVLSPMRRIHGSCSSRRQSVPPVTRYLRV